MSHVPSTVAPDTDEEAVAEVPVINCHRAKSDRRVFTEEGNTDGWIATDVTVDCRQ